jgi:hypothetical protein
MYFSTGFHGEHKNCHDKEFSLLSLTLCFSHGQNSCGLLFLMGCLHAHSSLLLMGELVLGSIPPRQEVLRHIPMCMHSCSWHRPDPINIAAMQWNSIGKVKMGVGVAKGTTIGLR